jgi:hypothetical protein
MGVEMAERGRPSALRALFIAERGGGKATQLQSYGHGKVAVAAVRMPTTWLGASFRTGSPTGGSRAVSDFS